MNELQIDLTNPSLYQRGFPHELFTELRSSAGVVRHPAAVIDDGVEVEFWAILRHAEIQTANRDWEAFSSFDGPSIAPFLPGAEGRTLVSSDPPDHTRVRSQIRAGFTPRMVRRLEELISSRTARILDEAESRAELDFVDDVASQLPMHVIADIVGVPETDRPDVFARIDLILRSFAPDQGILLDDRIAAQAELFAYAGELTAMKRAEASDDVWSILANGPLDGFEVDAFFPILATAGSETVRNTLSQGLIALLEHPEQLSLLRRAPGSIDTAAEELLRWASPAISFARTVTADVELGGQHLRAGERVALFYPSGNRDERVFANPFNFDVTRTPNPHLAFGGGGPHYCLGANLARTEIRVLLAALLERFSRIEQLGPAQWVSAGPSYSIGVAISSLPVRLLR